MMIQEIKQGMKVRNAGGDVFEIMGTKGDLVIVKMLDHNSGLKPVNYVHEIFTPGEILEIDQTSEIDMLLSGYYEVALEYLELVEDTEEVKEIEIPMFDKGDVVKDKFGNLYVIEDLVSPQQLERDTLEYDHMGYRLKIIEKNPSSPARKVGTFYGFYSGDACMWIYNTLKDAVNDEVIVTDAHIFATELELYDEDELIAEDADELDADDAEDIEVSDVPIFLPGDLVKDAFGNIFEVAEAKPSQRLDPDRFDYDNMGYRLKLATKNPQSPVREVHDNVKFVEEGSKFWVYNREEDARAVEEYNPYTITASELVLVRSVLQTKPAKPAKPAKAEIAKRYPSIEDLQKMSEENDIGKLLDQAYAILKEQASFGERIADLNFEKFKRCIPHFEREGFDITEHGMSIEVRW